MPLLMSSHSTYLAWGDEGRMVHVSTADAAGRRLVELTEARDAVIDGEGLSVEESAIGYHLKLPNGCYACADPRREEIETDRVLASWWESFVAVPRTILDSGFYKSSDVEADRFGRRVAELLQAGLPIKVQCGAGTSPAPDFLNLDITIGAPRFAAERPEQYFLFPCADGRWPVPDKSIDYVFHEDFIEHITQLQQIQFLTEVYRVLKPGGVHRVNTPNLKAAMERHSDFSKGFEGVYTGELEWGHICLFTPASLEEIARMIGYSEVRFTLKNQGTSPYAIEEHRPADDRDPMIGNVLVDLVK